MKEIRDNRKRRGGVDVLVCMFITFAVFHLEMSALNLGAVWNAVYSIGRLLMVGGAVKSNGGESEWTGFH